MRALWTSLVPDEAGRRTAFSLEATLVETAFVLGPLGVALALALGSAGLAVAAAALPVAVGSLGLAASALVRSWSPEREVPRSLAGPLTSRPLRWYGGRDWAWSPATQYPWLLGLLAAGFALPLLAGGLVSLGVLLAVGGLAIAPVTTCNSALVARCAPAGTMAEAFGWSTTSLFGGVSAGTAAGGWLVEAGGATGALTLAVAAGVAGLLVGVAGQRHLLAEPATA